MYIHLIYSYLMISVISIIDLLAGIVVVKGGNTCCAEVLS